MLKRNFPSDEICLKISGVLYDVATALREEGCIMIGHIKALIETDAGGNQFFSVTDFYRAPRTKGNISGTVSEAELLIDVIVYGVGEQKIEKVVDRMMNKYFQEVTM